MSSTEAKTVVLNTSDGETIEMDEAKTVAPKTSDGETFEVDEAKTVVLKSSDGEEFEVEEEVAVESLKIKHIIENASAGIVISLPKVSSGVLTRVIEYCRRHAFGEYDDTLKDYDAEFVKVDNELLFELISAAECLNIPGMLDITCQAGANMLKDKTPEEIRAMFNLTNDLTPEEEEEIRKEFLWAFV
ncbi:SKP1-like protein [Striga asiatica]|uniref:SKP1-like protein n=1 Tax=Striga asiatica TaxID=4170 RepID=A0A5A7R2L1_STRAF|nr:SKP1-like protein [Striga asiatica]